MECVGVSGGTGALRRAVLSQTVTLQLGERLLRVWLVLCWRRRWTASSRRYTSPRHCWSSSQGKSRSSAKHIAGCFYHRVREVQTRSQAVARIADRTASQQTIQ